MIEGIIIKTISDTYTVKTEEEILDCKARGIFRNHNISPMVGDIVMIDKEQKRIELVQPRKNTLMRPIVSNVDQALVVVSVEQPKLDLYLLDKLLLTIEYNHIEPIICFTKIDLLPESKVENLEMISNYYESLGYLVLKNTDMKQLKKILSKKITVLAGQSGAGKSTLLNRLNQELRLKTNEISKALGRGKHTTRHTELLPIFDGYVVDTPGFSSLSLETLKKEEIAAYMREFEQNMHQCKYANCSHIKEQDCAIKELVQNHKILLSRYQHYQKFIEEVK